MKISSNEIRKNFLEFFKNNDHLQIEGSSVIPKNDPTLLFINSGMAPLKNYFTGDETPPSPTLCNVQPCIRTIDIDDVGDRHHLTAFEMLGSWSINGYFKKGAIELAYDLLINKLQIPKEKLYVTVFEGKEELGLEPDHESVKYWEEVGIDKSHIIYQPFEDNFWGPTSETGPCGPCTEVFYDTGSEFGESYEESGVFETTKRYIEVWNAGVFMQYNKTATGAYDLLKFKSVDTGAGIERLAMTLNGYESVYEIDLLKPIGEVIIAEANKFNVKLTEEELRIILDHIRTSTFILAEGIEPFNSGRGYIPRKLIRKCLSITLRYNMDDFDYHKVIDKVIDLYKEYYSYLEENQNTILAVFDKEKDSFEATLKRGIGKLVELSENNNYNLSGEEAFDIVTTYGIPYDILEDIIKREKGSIDVEAYERLMEEHKIISNAATENTSKSLLKKLQAKLENCDKTDFLGYTEHRSEGQVLAIFNMEEEKVTKGNQGEEIILILDQTPFYAESGGQIYDCGTISTTNNATVFVKEVQKTDTNIFLHFCQVVRGEIEVGDQIISEIDEEKRIKVRRNHTATHLLQTALREVVDKSISQAGSSVDEYKLRFDFNYDKSLEADTLVQIQSFINELIRQNTVVESNLMTFEEAKKLGALAFFEDKYGDQVRLVQVGDISKELCGGTHAGRTGDLGLFMIVSEGSVGRGVRRIEAITGDEALLYVQEDMNKLKTITEVLRTNKDDVIDKVEKLITEAKKKPKQVSKNLTKNEIQQLAKQTEDGIDYLVYVSPEFDKSLRDQTEKIAQTIKGIACTLVISDEKYQIIVSVDPEMTKQITAGNLLRALTKKYGGGGGGKPHLAMGGGEFTTSLDDFEVAFPEFIKQNL